MERSVSVTCQRGGWGFLVGLGNHPELGDEVAFCPTRVRGAEGMVPVDAGGGEGVVGAIVGEEVVGPGVDEDVEGLFEELTVGVGV